MNLFSLLVLLLSFSFAATPCGQQGTVEERIKDCDTTKGEFVLVARDDKGFEIFQDKKTRILWGDRLRSDYNHYGSQKACTDDAPELQMLKDHKWLMPTIKDFEEAASHGMKQSLPRMGHWFWTSTPAQKVRKKRSRRHRGIPAQAYLWDGMGEVTDVGDIKDAASVRCLARP